jgi:hypothetical protein
MTDREKEAERLLRRCVSALMSSDDEEQSECGKRVRAFLATPATPPSFVEHIRPGDGKPCKYMALTVCNKCGWVAPAEPQEERYTAAQIREAWGWTPDTYCPHGFCRGCATEVETLIATLKKTAHPRAETEGT